MEYAPCAIWPIFGPNGPIMHLNDLLTYSQTKPKTADFSCEPGINAVKTVKDAFKMFRRYSHTIIAHENLQHMPRPSHSLLITFRILDLNSLHLDDRAKYYLDDTTTRREL